MTKEAIGHAVSPSHLFANKQVTVTAVGQSLPVLPTSPGGFQPHRRRPMYPEHSSIACRYRRREIWLTTSSHKALMHNVRSADHIRPAMGCQAACDVQEKRSWLQHICNCSDHTDWARHRGDCLCTCSCVTVYECNVYMLNQIKFNKQKQHKLCCCLPVLWKFFVRSLMVSLSLLVCPSVCLLVLYSFVFYCF